MNNIPRPILLNIRNHGLFTGFVGSLFNDVSDCALKSRRPQKTIMVLAPKTNPCSTEYVVRNMWCRIYGIQCLVSVIQYIKSWILLSMVSGIPLLLGLRTRM